VRVTNEGLQETIKEQTVNQHDKKQHAALINECERRIGESLTPNSTGNSTNNSITFAAKVDSQQLKLKGQFNQDLKQCSNCEMLHFENLELKEALSRQSPLINADEICKHEIEFTVPKQKYPNLKEAMKESRDSIHIIFDKTGTLESVVADIFRAKQNYA
jgi:hypothetical protein